MVSLVVAADPLADLERPVRPVAKGEMVLKGGMGPVVIILDWSVPVDTMSPMVLAGLVVNTAAAAVAAAAEGPVWLVVPLVVVAALGAKVARPVPALSVGALRLALSLTQTLRLRSPTTQSLQPLAVTVVSAVRGPKVAVVVPAVAAVPVISTALPVATVEPEVKGAGVVTVVAAAVVRLSVSSKTTALRYAQTTVSFLAMPEPVARAARVERAMIRTAKPVSVATRLNSKRSPHNEDSNSEFGFDRSRLEIENEIKKNNMLDAWPAGDASLVCRMLEQ
jgi:hypothetical protein